MSNEIGYDLMIGLSTGLISGTVSAVIVTLVFNASRKKSDLLKSFDEDRQNLNRFLQNIQDEFEIMKKNSTSTSDVLIHLFSKRPITISFKENLEEESLEKLSKIDSLIKEAESKAKSSFKLNELDVFIGKLFKARVDALSLQSKKCNWKK